MLRLFTMSVLIFCFAVLPVRGQDVDYYWNFANGGNFQASILWSPFSGGFFGPGDETDRAHFDLGMTPDDRYLMTNVNGINEQLIIENDSLTLQIGEYETVGPGEDFTASVVVGRLNGDVADVIFTGGPGSELRSVNTSIGFLDVATGVVTVDGVGFEWTNSNEIVIAESGTGSLVIQNGGTCCTSHCLVSRHVNSVGMVTADGAGSTWNVSDILFLGTRGDGTLNVQNGASVFTRNTYLGWDSVASGTATIDGQGSAFTSSGLLNVGFVGTGSLNIQNGALVSTVNGILADQSAGGADVTVDGVGSTWQNSGHLFMGFRGDGNLTVQNGGSVSTARGSIALYASSLATATITGTGSQLIVEGTLSIAGNSSTGVSGGFGILEIAAGGSVIVNDDTILFPNAFLDLDGGTFVSDSIVINEGGDFDFISGTLHVGTFFGDLLNQAGTLAPGQSAGNTTIIGNYTQDNEATLEIEIGGTAVSTEFDFVNATGDVFLDGQLELVLINGFLPSTEDSFTIVNVDPGTLFGFFNNVGDNQRVETVGGEGSFLVRYGVTSPNPTQIILSEFEPSFVVGQSLLVTRGNHVSGSIDQLTESDNADVSIQRAAADIQSRTEFEVKGISPIATPSSMEFTLEGAVFARSNVVQTIELFDYVAAAWVLIDSQNAARSPDPDLVVTVAATGELSRFVEAGTMCIEARVRYQSVNPRQNFASNTDRAVWTIH